MPPLNPFEETPLTDDTLTQEPSRRFQGFRELQSEMLNTTASTPEAPPDAPKVKKLNASTVAIFERVRTKILKKQSNRSTPLGRREHEYSLLLNNNDTKPLEERVNTEIPTLGDFFSRAEYNEIKNNWYGYVHVNPRYSTFVACHKCSEWFETPFVAFVFSRAYCLAHLPNFEMCAVCNGMSDKISTIDVVEGKTVPVCERCISRRQICGNCAHPIKKDRVLVGMCEGCTENLSRRGIGRRSFSQGLRWTSKDTGKVVMSPRIYSCEIEALSPMRDYEDILGNNLPDECGIGRDGSVHGVGSGFEIQTPKLAGARGEELIHRMCSVVKSTNAYVNESCGMHIHIDGAGLVPLSRKEYPGAFVRFWKTHLVFESVILSLLPFTRRKNDYCRPMGSTFTVSQLDSIETMFDIEKLLYRVAYPSRIREAKSSRYHPSRYFGINLHSLLAHGHLEVRYHPGTINPRKILEWANLHTLIVDACINNNINEDVLEEALSTTGLSEKTKLLFESIKLPHSSFQFFLQRQRKFAKKENPDEEVITTNSPIPNVSNGGGSNWNELVIRNGSSSFAYSMLNNEVRRAWTVEEVSEITNENNEEEF